jgi:hypothetical protein
MRLWNLTVGASLFDEERGYFHVICNLRCETQSLGNLTTSYSATISYSEHSITCRLRNQAGYNVLYCSISCDACRRDVGFTVQPRLCKNAICFGVAVPHPIDPPYCSISCDACRRDVGFTVQPRLCKNAICTSKCIS